MKTQRKKKLTIILEMFKDMYMNGRITKEQILIKHDIGERTFQRYIKELKLAGVKIEKPYMNTYKVAEW